MKAWKWKDKNPFCKECNKWGHIGCLPFDFKWNFKDIKLGLLKSPEVHINKSIHKKKRFRKKLHQKEFQELGFNFELKLKPEYYGKNYWKLPDKVFDDFMDFLHDYGLCLTGFPYGLISVCSPHSKRLKLHVGHIKLVENYIKNIQEVEEYRFSDFLDMWYCTDEQFDEIKFLPWIKK